MSQQAKTIEVPSAKFGRYTVRHRLGMGGMAEVFLAEAIDERGDQLNVALKLMKPDAPEEMFATEADLMGLLVHPNLVQRYEVGQAFGRSFIAMEYLLGGDLAALQSELMATGQKMPVNVAIHIALEVLKGLGYFHQATTRTGTPLNLVHSDVNPSNIFFSGRGQVKLGDYGVATSREANLGPQDGAIAGKLTYLAPECAKGEEDISQVADIYSMGIVLYELVVGEHPDASPDAPDDTGLLSMWKSGTPKVKSLPDTVDKPLAAIVQRALMPDSKSRARSAGDLGGQLYGYALDRDLLMSETQFLDWLRQAIGLAV